MFNKLVLRALFSLSFIFGLVGAANATLINQDIWFDSALTVEVDYKRIGFISIDITGADIYEVYDNDLQQWVTLGAVDQWVDFSFYNFDFWTEAEDNISLANDPFAFPMFGFFEAVFNVNNISVGIESLDFSVIENKFDYYAFNGYIDMFGGEALDIFNVDEGFHDFGDLAFGQATVVPTPATLVLFLTAVMGLVVRRKTH
jgi:hypothetical protein